MLNQKTFWPDDRTKQRCRTEVLFSLYHSLVSKTGKLILSGSVTFSEWKHLRTSKCPEFSVCISREQVTFCVKQFCKQLSSHATYISYSKQYVRARTRFLYLFRIILQHHMCVNKKVIIVYWIGVVFTHLTAKSVMSMGSSEYLDKHLPKLWISEAAFIQNLLQSTTFAYTSVCILLCLCYLKGVRLLVSFVPWYSLWQSAASICTWINRRQWADYFWQPVKGEANTLTEIDVQN